MVKGQAHIEPNEYLLQKQIVSFCIPIMSIVWSSLHQMNQSLFTYKTSLDLISITQVVMSYSSHSNLGYNGVASELGLDVVGSTICKKRQRIQGDFYLKMYRDMLTLSANMFSSKKTHSLRFDHIYAIDGSCITCTTHNPKQPQAGLLFSMMYDVTNSIPIDFVLLPEYDERKAVLEHHIHNIPPNTLLLVDRGYFSDELLQTLSNLGISVIFRMKKSYIRCQNLLKKDKKRVQYEGFQLANCSSVIKHKNEDETYIFGSNFKATLHKIASYYKCRWTVETFFQYFKSQTQTSYLQSSNFNNCKQEIYTKVLGYLHARIIEKVALNSISNKHVSIKGSRIIKDGCKNQKMVNFRKLLTKVHCNMQNLLTRTTYLETFKSICKYCLKGLVDCRVKHSKRLSQDEIESKKCGKKPSLKSFCKLIGNSIGNFQTRIFRWRSKVYNTYPP